MIVAKILPSGAQRRRSARILAFFVVASCLLSVRPAVGFAGPRQVRYTVSLARAAEHLVHVRMEVPAGAPDRELQLPVWNALYQVRDFSQYVAWVRARAANGRALAVTKVDKSRWRISSAEAGTEIEYEIFADDPGPYGAQLNLHHAFFNLAEILMYPLDERASPVAVRFTDIPAGWKTATTLADSAGEFSAENYDRLVDAPVEIGTFQESDFDQGGGHYRLIVDADHLGRDIKQLVDMLRRIVASQTSWMDDRPFQSYVFIYHFPNGPAGGGMEHAYSTAIDMNAQTLANDPVSFAGLSAHEFFHLWNVKRIRPQSLEPVDYTQEDYTRSLWFCEGFTSTVEGYTLTRTGMLDEAQYLARLSFEIEQLQRRPAHLTQSAEESSLDTWLDKYDYYRLPERSISYYNKGQLIGVILDLAIRDATRGRASLRELFRRMNDDARQGRFFRDTDGVREAAEAVSHTDLRSFFAKYVAGTDEIPWDEFFKSVGLHIAQQMTTVADPGFVAVRNHDVLPAIAQVISGGKAERAGLSVGDSIVEINGHSTGIDFERRLNELRSGETLRLKVRNSFGDRELHWKLDSKQEVDYQLRDLDRVTPQQAARRAAWLKGEPQAAEAASR